jgi:segregation and condensation protein B
MNLPLHAQLEATLFWKGEPVTLKRLAEAVDRTEMEVVSALAELEANLAGRGLALVRHGNEVMLGTAPEAAPIVEKLTKDELIRDLGKAGLETLTIVLYQGPVSRAEIDYIRGVNSNFILRNLLIRGLVEKVENEKDKRAFLYKPTFELISHLGLRNLEELPEYEAVRKEILDFKDKKKNPDMDGDDSAAGDTQPENNAQ